ncbi:MAG: signal peptidase II, partial [Verrucomicrobiae bacterium]|nr:signal peptidase II [Verrucomicrobiae bacterium]
MLRVGIVALIIVLLDQLSKALVVRFISPSEPVPVLEGFFQLVHWRNTGAAWGILRGYNLLLTAVSVATLLALYWFRRSFGMERPLAGWSLGLIVGGIVGNLIDRARLGAVV